MMLATSVCGDFRSMCEGSKCCRNERYASGPQFGCCPYEFGVCCPELNRCCPIGYHCASLSLVQTLETVFGTELATHFHCFRDSLLQSNPEGGISAVAKHTRRMFSRLFSSSSSSEHTQQDAAGNQKKRR